MAAETLGHCLTINFGRCSHHLARSADPLKSGTPRWTRCSTATSSSSCNCIVPDLQAGRRWPAVRAVPARRGLRCQGDYRHQNGPSALAGLRYWSMCGPIAALAPSGSPSRPPAPPGSKIFPVRAEFAAERPDTQTRARPPPPDGACLDPPGKATWRPGLKPRALLGGLGSGPGGRPRLGP
jgi:hypothetical protein